jgi:hypothetical protein
MNAAMNVYNACDGYKSSTGRTVEWTKSNPDAWDIASNVMMQLREERRAEKETANG